MTKTLPAMEKLRGALSDVSYRSGTGKLPDDFHGGKGTNNQHAYWLPEDDDDDGLIDHVIVYAASGIADRVIAQLASMTWFRLGDHRYTLKPSYMGPLPEGGLFGRAKTWVAITPYVTPRRTTYDNGKPRAKDKDWDYQLRKEIDDRREKGEKLQAVVSIAAKDWQWLGVEQRWTDEFVASRREKDGPRADAIAKFPTITFADPVEGPLAFGFGAHFGLGLVWPAG